MGRLRRQRYLVDLTVEEIGVVIISKAFASQPDGYIQLTLIACEDGGFQLHVRDNAAGFDPFSLAAQKLGRTGRWIWTPSAC